MVLKTVYIARHGDVIKRETTPGRDGEEEVFPPTGVPGDFPLSATGVLQSRELGHYLLSLDTQPEAILSSPGYRTVQTATLVNDLLEVPLFVDTGLNTWAQDDGDEDDDGAAQPADVDTLNKLFKDSVKGDWESCVPAATSAETQEILFARCKLFLSKVAEQLDKQVPDAETVLLVTDAPVKVALGLNLLRYGRCIDYLDDEEQTTIRSGYCSLDKYELAVRYNEEEDEEDQIVVPLTDREWRMTMNGNTEFLKSGEVGNWSFDRDSVVPSADREGSPADPETETVYVSVDLNSGSYKNRLQIEKNAVMQYSGMDQERPLFRIGDKIYEGSWERLVGTEFAFPDEAQLHRRTGMERAETAAAVTGNGDSPDALPERHHSAEDGSSDSSGFSDDEVAVATPEKRAERLYRIKDRLVLHSLNAVSPAIHSIAMLGTGSEYQVILASSSPRRYEILSDNIGIRNLQTTVPSFEENLDKRLYVGRPLDYVRDTARGKASSIVADLASGRLESLQGSSSGALIVCADTVVIGPDGQVYEKPGTRERQLQYLHRFCYESAGRPVVVATAVAIVKWPCGGTMKEHSVHTFEETTEVYFDGTTPRDVIEAYVSSGDGLQVAGGFKIQGPGGVLIKRINGDYYTVVGLPLNATFRALLALQR